MSAMTDGCPRIARQVHAGSFQGTRGAKAFLAFDFLSQGARDRRRGPVDEERWMNMKQSERHSCMILIAPERICRLGQAGRQGLRDF